MAEDEAGCAQKCGDWDMGGFVRASCVVQLQLRAWKWADRQWSALRVALLFLFYFLCLRFSLGGEGARCAGAGLGAAGLRWWRGKQRRRAQGV